MSLLKFIKAQLGMSSTPANNFTLDASAQDGTLKLSRGNAGATTQDVMVVGANGKLTVPQGIESEGGLPVFQCRAWVYFRGVGTPTILAGGNVASVTRAGTGNYTITFTTPMPSVNYAVIGNAIGAGGVSYGSVANAVDGGLRTTSQVGVTTSALNMSAAQTPFDSPGVSVLIFS